MTVERFFNTEGPVNCEKHYCLDPLFRMNVQEILELIGREKYFVLHAPRQTGKTSCLLALMAHLNQKSGYTCLYVIDLGLIRRSSSGGIEIANDIYREVIPRELTWGLQSGIYQETLWYIEPDGRLNMNKLLSAFQEFFREHSEHWIERFQYKEAGPQLLIQAFLQRIVNGGGRVEREYGLGRLRTDLLVIWPFPGGIQKAVMEVKILYKGLQKTISDGLAQTREYMDRCGASNGHLLIFDRTEGKPWEEKIFRKEVPEEGAPATVWGM